MEDETFLSVLESLDNPDLWRRYNNADRISPDKMPTYCKMLEELISDHENRGTQEVDRRRRGKLLEMLVNFMVNNSGNMYKVFSNFHTSTNEIDQIVVLSEKGVACQKLGGYDFKGSHFLGECKNYDTAVGVTYVGKFCHLAQISASRLGILFSYHGFTGKEGSWDDSTGLIKKFHLSKERAEDRYYIIDFNINDFKLIKEGETFYQIIKTKCLALETDTRYADFIQAHPAECDLPTVLP